MVAELTPCQGKAEFSATLPTAILELAIFCSRDKNRAHLSGIWLEKDGDYLACVATDGHRMTIVHVPCLDFSGETQFVPFQALLAAKKAAGRGKNREAFVRIAKGHIIVGNTTIQLGNTDIRFPDWRQVCPKAEWHVGDVMRPYGFNPSYVGDVGAFLSAAGYPVAVAHTGYTGELSPLRFDGGGDGFACTFIVMPVRI
jgi:hypothetical protein